MGVQLGRRCTWSRWERARLFQVGVMQALIQMAGVAVISEVMVAGRGGFEHGVAMEVLTKVRTKHLQNMWFC